MKNLFSSCFFLNYEGLDLKSSTSRYNMLVLILNNQNLDWIQNLTSLLAKILHLLVCKGDLSQFSVTTKNI